MDKEMMAKIKEALKAKGNQKLQELSMDDLDEVAGGYCYDASKIKTEEDLNYFVYTYLPIVKDIFGDDGISATLKGELPSDNINYNGNLDNVYNYLHQKYFG